MVMKLQHSLFIIPCSIFLFASCSVSKQINKRANTVLLNDTAISTGHIGISIYEPATNTYWYNYNATKNFIPASNTKLFTLYAGMKYLGDSLVGLRYLFNPSGEYSLYPNGDPTFLHTDFKNQPVLSFLKTLNPNKWNAISINTWKTNALGKGWAWDDYNSDYMAQRSLMPVYGNTVTFIFRNDSLIGFPYGKFDIIPANEFDFNEKSQFLSRDKEKLPKNFSIKRIIATNGFEFIKSTRKFESITIPFVADNYLLNAILKDTLNFPKGKDFYFFKESKIPKLNQLYVIHSQPSDSLFIPMMHRSDNFFAEQTLLMASNEHLGYMSDEKMIDTILKSDLKDIPQKPKWVDGSGLSRYNLFTPQSFVYILNKIKNEFGWDRVKNILPTGGTGTLSSYYKKDSSFIYAKTGTLSNNCALSGYLITKKGKLLIFSILVNNYQSGATPVRKAVELFLTEIREKY
jgi:D-alanyl-D-alanine carboxypeptidase/D-alanyl-D-alanine-endopeptidase (penicillin-binding protein 4)